MKQPNVILVYPDQLRFDALSCNGNTVSHTPRMDELASEGSNFQRSYSSYPLCCPFRASLMTGLYPHKNGMYSNHYPLATDLPHYLPKIMRDNGYKTAWIGKWHLNGGKKFEAVPKEYWCGFDELIGYGRGHHYIDSLYYRNEDPMPYKSEKFEPLYQTEHLIDFVDRSLAEEKPFMGMICYGLPHPPVEMQPEHYKYMFSPEDIALPVTVPPHHQEKAKAYIAMYYGMVKCVDEQIGRLIDHLKEKGVYDDTVFIVLSDHGDMCGEFGMYEKSIFYDASAHTPMIVRYPAKVKAGSRPTQMVDSLIDVTPTILDLCDISVPETMDGLSMGNILRYGQDPIFRDYTYYEILRVPEELCDVMDKPDRKNYAERGFRTADTVYVERANVPFAYYDLTTDPLEQYNCIDNFKFYPQIKECRAKLSEMMRQYGDDWSLQRDQLPPDFQTQKEAMADYANAYQKASYETTS